MNENSPSHGAVALPPIDGVGAQLIIFSEQERHAFEQVVRQCKDAGYNYLEATLNILEVSPESVVQALSAHDMPLKAIHVGYPNIRTDEGTERVLEYLRIVEAPFLICSGRDAGSLHPEYSAVQSADRFNCVGERCAERGITFYYHCFDCEFQTSAGVNFLENLLSRTNEELVRYNIDLMWTKAAGQDAVKVIQSIGHRCDYYHFKDGAGLSNAAAPKFLPLGQGEVGIERCLEAVVSLGNPYYLVVEQDRPLNSPSEDLTESREFLRTLGV